jgi:hypothetical protein
MLEVPEAVASNSLAKAVRKGISRLRAVPGIFDINGGAFSDSVLECRAGCDIQELRCKILVTATFLPDRK